MALVRLLCHPSPEAPAFGDYGTAILCSRGLKSRPEHLPGDASPEEGPGITAAAACDVWPDDYRTQGSGIALHSGPDYPEYWSPSFRTVDRSLPLSMPEEKGGFVNMDEVLMVKAVSEGVRIAGFGAAVPRPYHSFLETPAPFTAEEAAKLCASTGVRCRRILPPHLCASDMALAAAENLLSRLDWEPARIDVLIFVSQDADYNLPATACLLQRRLGLPRTCAAFDVALGCSGFIYGLWLASRLLGNGTAQRALVLCGDVSSRHLAPGDRSTLPLFGDAGGAAALEWDPSAPPLHFCLGTDGRGASSICVEAGGRRNPLTPGLVARTPEQEAALFRQARLSLNGAEVFAFTLRAVPELIRETLEFAGLDRETLDQVVLHQANRFMLEHLRKKTGFREDQFVIAIEPYGNTSSASIPLAICHQLGNGFFQQPRTLLLAGFGVGWSWGALAGRIGPLPLLGVYEMPDDTVPLHLSEDPADP